MIEISHLTDWVGGKIRIVSMLLEWALDPSNLKISTNTLRLAKEKIEILGRRSRK